MDMDIDIDMDINVEPWSPDISEELYRAFSLYNAFEGTHKLSSQE